MNDYEKIFDFQNLYKAHTVARRGKRSTREVIDFEVNLAGNLTLLSDSLKAGTYKMQDYYSFVIHDPKYRVIHALHYRDRVVQHCLCDEVLAPILDNRLIYDNSACRIGKGTHFAIRRVSKFLSDFHHQYGTYGYFLKCDIRKYFDNIDHDVLKRKLCKVIDDKNVLRLLYQIIDSFEVSDGKGLPLGNQTSQWFALFYLDGLDRLIKENLRIKYYSRYMDDCVLIHQDKDYLKFCLEQMKQCAADLHIEFNEKTDIFPIKNGVDYLGWHIYLTESGKVVRKVRQQTKYRYKRKLKHFQKSYACGTIELAEVNQVLSSYCAHLAHGHTYKLQTKVLREFILEKNHAEDRKMAIDKLKVMLSFMREINDGNVPKPEDYNLNAEAFWYIVEACQDEGLIKDAAHAGPVLYLDNTKLTVKGMEYLHEHSGVMRTYRGLKELRDWLPF